MKLVDWLDKCEQHLTEAPDCAETNLRLAVAFIRRLLSMIHHDWTPASGGSFYATRSPEDRAQAAFETLCKGFDLNET